MIEIHTQNRKTNNNNNNIKNEGKKSIMVTNPSVHTYVLVKAKFFFFFNLKNNNPQHTVNLGERGKKIEKRYIFFD
jgi:hypothetical protein